MLQFHDMRRLPYLPDGLRVGLFGGSFNPAHAGHRHVAACARRVLGLDTVLWAVSPQNPLKPAYGMSLNERAASAQRAAVHPRDRVSTFEADIDSRCTADTLDYLRRRRPRVRWVWIMGADNAAGFHRWQRPDDIMHAMPTAVIGRPEHVNRALHAPFARRYARYRIHESAAPSLVNTAAPAWVFLNLRRDHRSSTAIRSGRMGDGL